MTDLLSARIEKAKARATVGNQSTFVTLATPAGPHDPLVVALGFNSLTYWEQPSLEIAIAADGVACELDLDGANRFSTASAGLRALRARTTQVAIDDAERSPVLIGGFSFLEICDWPGFPPGRFVLPELAFVRRRATNTWVAAAEVTQSTEVAALADELRQRIAVAESGSYPSIEEGGEDHGRAPRVDLRDAAYVKVVDDAVAEIKGGELSKVVLARQLIIDHSPDVGRFLAALRERYPTCATYALSGENGVFVGASPERLVHVDGVAVSTSAVAGTAPRGADATQDEVIADRLRHDPKEIEEHGYVTSDIRRRLANGGFVLDDSGPTDIMRLPGIQHLVTQITGTAPVGTNVLDVVGALHPTPAVAGLPVAEALEWIDGHEPLERGWYAGPVGYCDLAGNGEFRVALRSALLEPGVSRLFAGAGIVEASSPERELEETSLKFGALLPSLLGS